MERYSARGNHDNRDFSNSSLAISFECPSKNTPLPCGQKINWFTSFELGTPEPNTRMAVQRLGFAGIRTSAKAPPSTPLRSRRRQVSICRLGRNSILVSSYLRDRLFLKSSGLFTGVCQQHTGKDETFPNDYSLRRFGSLRLSGSGFPELRIQQS